MGRRGKAEFNNKETLQESNKKLPFLSSLSLIGDVAAMYHEHRSGCSRHVSSGVIIVLITFVTLLKHSVVDVV